jgi:hypothetical protein
VSRSLDGETILVGEAKWSRNPLGVTGLADAAARLLRRPLPPPVAEAERHGTIVVRALFAPAFAKAEVHGTGIHVMSAAELFS